ncbi:MAG: TonB-dependent siderophore receptor [Xanthomonadales bacterium]|nr:TonB-dependent siderophore receptor [Xanthomonadales bacterium]
MSFALHAMPRASLLSVAVSAALIPAFSAFPALAAEAAANDPETLDAVEVVGNRPSYQAPPSRTATRTDTPTLRTLQNVLVVPRAVLEDQNALNVADAVRNVAGTGTDFGFNGGSLPLLIVRGFPTVSMSAQGSTTSSYFFNGTKVQGLPVAMSDIESVEVVKGPASVLYGRSEPGGLVNIVTRQPQAERGFRASATAGSFGLLQGSAEIFGALDQRGQWQGRAAISHDDNASNRDFVEDRLSAFSAALAWVPSDRTRLSFGLERSRQRYRNDYGIPAIGDRPANIDRDNQFNEGGPLSRQDNTVARIDLAQMLSERWTLNVHALALDQDGAQYDLLPSTFFSGQAGLIATGRIDRLYNYEPQRDRQLYQFNADLVGKLSTGSLEHTLLIGADTYRDRFDSKTTSFVPGPSIDIRNPVYGQVPPLDLSALPLFDQEGRTRWTGVYVQDQIAFANGIELIAGVRHDRSSARFGAPGTRANDQRFTTPRLGAVWQFAPNQSVYAQFQEGVSANNGRNLAGDSLDSEQARLYEIGHKLQANGGRLTSTVALYQLTKRNIANYVPDISGFFDTIAVGEARARGLEWDLSGQLTDRLAVIASYAYTQSEVTCDENFVGKRLPNVPRHSGSVWARYAAGERWTFGGGVFAQGGRAGDRANTFVLPGYARVDAMAAYRFPLGRAKGQLQFNVNNLFDREYFTGSHQHVTDWNQPGAPRTVLATFRIDY